MKYLFIILILVSCNVTQAPVTSVPVQKPVIVTLNGSKSYDPDGKIISWQWRQVSGSPLQLNNSTDTIANVTIGTKGVYPFELTVTDNNGAIGKDTAQITIY